MFRGAVIAVVMMSAVHAQTNICFPLLVYRHHGCVVESGCAFLLDKSNCMILNPGAQVHPFPDPTSTTVTTTATVTATLSSSTLILSTDPATQTDTTSDALSTTTASSTTSITSSQTSEPVYISNTTTSADIPGASQPRTTTTTTAAVTTTAPLDLASSSITSTDFAWPEEANWTTVPAAPALPVANDPTATLITAGVILLLAILVLYKFRKRLYRIAKRTNNGWCKSRCAERTPQQPIIFSHRPSLALVPSSRASMALPSPPRPAWDNGTHALSNKRVSNPLFSASEYDDCEQDKNKHDYMYADCGETLHIAGLGGLDQPPEAPGPTPDRQPFVPNFDLDASYIDIVEDDDEGDNPLYIDFCE
eukprot:TRINITY_DN8674_c0_g1_i3.p1 TRINITY_DN8674_c0_g1~~TRINITY_DN8674_c0_g1_i3.p1  ORF type:complete len:364 (+),score=53.67 TRINITY_DN8674_c0_g1_i3:108-1199(+)